MFKIKTTSIRASSVFCGLAGLMASAGAVHGQDSSDFWQHLRVGAPVTFNLRAHFSESGQFNLPTSQTGATNVSGVNHVYDDGYVLVDSTGNAGGYTSYWGYTNASQYNQTAQTLTMHSVNSYTASGGDTSSGSAFVGVEAAYGTDLWKWDRVHVGWELGLGLLPIKITDFEPLAATVNQSAFSFDTTGISVMPTAPYSGGPGIPGVATSAPTIHDIATALTNTTVAGTVTGSRSLDVILYTVRLGPTIYWDMNQYVGVMAGAGPVAGLVSGNYEFNENILTPGGGIANNSGKMGMTKPVFGGYVNGELLFHVVKHGDLYIGGQFMPLGSANFNGGGREARLELNGAVQVTAGINWPF